MQDQDTLPSPCWVPYHHFLLGVLLAISSHNLCQGVWRILNQRLKYYSLPSLSLCIHHPPFPTCPPYKIPLMNLQWRLSSSSPNSTPPPHEQLNHTAGVNQEACSPLHLEVQTDGQVGVIKLTWKSVFVSHLVEFQRLKPTTFITV